MFEISLKIYFLGMLNFVFPIYLENDFILGLWLKNNTDFGVKFTKIKYGKLQNYKKVFLHNEKRGFLNLC